MASKFNMKTDAVQDQLSSNKSTNSSTSYTPVYQRNGGSYFATTTSSNSSVGALPKQTLKLETNKSRSLHVKQSMNSFQTANTSNSSVFNKASALSTLKLETSKSQRLFYSFGDKQSIPEKPPTPVANSFAPTVLCKPIKPSYSSQTANTSNLSMFNKASALPTLKLETSKIQGPYHSYDVKQSVPIVETPLKTNLLSNIFSFNSNRGYALILNHYKYEKDFQSTREGTQFDVDKLKNVFAHFKIETIVKSDLRLSQIKTEVNKLKMKDFSKYKCFIVVILTHGNRNQSLCASDKSYNFIDEIENPLIENRTLVDIPKIFIIQACRGIDEMFVFETDSESVSRRTNLFKRNIFKCNATYEGYVSFRNTRNGTIFIQTLCEKLKEVGKTEPIYNVMMKVIDEVSSNPEVAQVPTVESSMVKPFCFGSLL